MKQDILILTGAGFSTAFLEPLDIVKKKFRNPNIKLTTKFITDSIIDKNFINNWRELFEEDLRKFIRKPKREFSLSHIETESNDFGLEHSFKLFDLAALLYQNIESNYNFSDRNEIKNFETLYYLIEEAVNYSPISILSTVFDLKKELANYISVERYSTLERFTEYILSIVNYFYINKNNQEFLTHFFQHLFEEYNIRAFTLNYDNVMFDSLKRAAFDSGIFLEMKIPNEYIKINLSEADSTLIDGDPYEITKIKNNYYYNLHGSVNYRLGILGKLEFEYTEPGKYILTNKDPVLPPTEYRDKLNNYHKSTMITGYNKVIKTNIEPYLSIYQKFSEDIQKTDELLIIGYSFGDAHINNIIKLAVPYLELYENQGLVYKKNKKIKKITIVGFCEKDSIKKEVDQINRILINEIVEPKALEWTQEFNNRNCIYDGNKTVQFKLNNFEMFYDFRGAIEYVNSTLSSKKTGSNFKRYILANNKLKEDKVTDAFWLYTGLINDNYRKTKIYLNRAKIFLINDSFSNALNDINLFLTNNDRNREALKLKASILLKLEKTSEVLDVYNKLLEINKNDWVVHFLRGRLEQNENNLQEAFNDYEIYVSGTGKSGEYFYNAHFNKGTILAKWDDFENAIRNYSIAIRTKDEKLKLRALKSRGLLSLKGKKYENTLKDFFQVLAIDKTDEKTIFNIGYTYYILKDFTNSKSWLNKSNRVNGNKKSYYLLAKIYFTENEYAKTIKYSTKALEYYKDGVQDYEICKIRGKAYFNLKKYSEALNDIMIVLKYKSDDISMYYYKSSILYNTTENQTVLTEALNDINHYLASEPFDTDALFLKFYICIKINNLNDIKPNLDEYVGKNPNDGNIYCLYGMYYFTLNDFDNATNLFIKAAIIAKIQNANFDKENYLKTLKKTLNNATYINELKKKLSNCSTFTFENKD